MYKTLFFLGTAVATLSSPSIDCSSGDIQSEDTLPSLPTAPQDAAACRNNCNYTCASGGACLYWDDTLAGCSFDVYVVDHNIICNESCAAVPTKNGQWSLASQEWSVLPNVTISFGNDSITAIDIGIAAESGCDPTSPTFITCTIGECDITGWVRSKSGPLDVVVQDQTTPGSPSDLSRAVAQVTAYAGKMYGAAKTCTDLKTDWRACQEAGCKYCLDTAATQEGYLGCGVSPSVCVEDGATSASTINNLMSVTMVSLAIGALFY